ncbi:MAG: DUF1385 domain-containing protein [Clostridia bacterium]|nr:DUF1385 domain-containing protein [Clostridia bacterium]
MAKKNQSSVCSRLGAIGGQAVLEGIMMRSKEQYTTAVRVTETGEIVRDTHKVTSVSEKHKWMKWPLVRGIVNFVESMKLSYSTLTFSAEAQGLDAEPETKFEKWLVNTFGEKLMAVVAGIGTVLGLCLAVVLFMWLPKFLSDLAFPVSVSRFLNALLQGIVRIAIFVGYIAAVSLMKDMRRTFEYHGAEHKSIFCYEAGEELTVENIKKKSRFHPRCGTSFFFVMMLLGILLSVFLNFIPLPEAAWSNLVYTLLKLVTLPLVVAVGYEIIRFAGRHDNAFVRVLTAPGLWMQRLTTREPDDSQIEVAIVALKSALPEEFSEEDVFFKIAQPGKQEPEELGERADA